MKSIRFDGISYCEDVTATQLTLKNGRCDGRLRLTLDFGEISYLAQQLHKMIKLNQERLDDAKKAMRGE